MADYLGGMAAVLKINENEGTGQRTRSIILENSPAEFVDNFMATVLLSHCYKAGEESSLPFDITILQDLFDAECTKRTSRWSTEDFERLSDGFHSPVTAFTVLTELLGTKFESIFQHELDHYTVCSGSNCPPAYHGPCFGESVYLECSVAKVSNQLDACVSFIDPTYEKTKEKVCKKCLTANVLTRCFKDEPPDVFVLTFCPLLKRTTSITTAVGKLAVPQNNVLISKEFFMMDSNGTQHAYLPVSVIQRPVTGANAHFTVSHLSRVDKMKLILNDHHEMVIEREIENNRSGDKFWTLPASLVFCVRNPQYTPTSSTPTTTAPAVVQRPKAS